MSWRSSVSTGWLAFFCLSAAARDISFEDRVQAQEAIERVYYSHQTEARLPFEAAVTRDLLERKVTTYLRQSVAPAERWHTPITAEALARELDRIARSTHYPERLEEIYRALGGDPILIQECFARPALVERLARSFFASDPEIHRDAAGRAGALYGDLVAGAIDARESPERDVIVYVVGPQRSFDAVRPGTCVSGPRPDQRRRELDRLGVRPGHERCGIVRSRRRAGPRPVALLRHRGFYDGEDEGSYGGRPEAVGVGACNRPTGTSTCE